MSETATDRLARLLALVPWLRAHDGITIGEAAAHFGVDADQLTTDLWQLIVCGIPGYGPDQLVDIQFWDDDRVHVIDAISLERPLRLTGEEVAALQVALRVLAQVPGNHDRAALVSAMAKLENSGAPPVAMSVSVDIDPAVRSSIDAAIAQGSWLDIDYAAAYGDEISSRRIRPLKAYAIDDQVYLQAWCEVASDIRTFRLDRIHAAASVDGPTDSIDIVESATQIDPAGSPRDLHEARLAIDPQALWIVDTEDLEANMDGPTPQAKIRYASMDYLVRWVLGHGGRVQVLEPPEARRAVYEAAQARISTT